MKEGDFVKLDFDAFVKETDQLVDTTHEEVAKEHDVYNERAQYTPISAIVGSGSVVKGLDEALKTAKVGEDKEVEVKPEEAFGEKDPMQVEVFPMKKVLSLPEFRKGDKYPMEGMDVRINNRIGYINRIFTGRVWIDFNNRWAGKTIVYKFKIIEALKKKEDKIKALIENAYPAPDEFQFQFKGKDEVEITLPDMVKLDSSWAMAKFRLVSDLRSHLGLKTVKLIEVYVKKEEEPAAEEHTHECDDPDCKHDHHKEEEKKEEEKKETPKKKAPAKKKESAKKETKEEKLSEEKKE